MKWVATCFGLARSKRVAVLKNVEVFVDGGFYHFIHYITTHNGMYSFKICKVREVWGTVGGY